MQREKTIEFWNDYYSNDQDSSEGPQHDHHHQEWISSPSDSLVEKLQSHFPVSDATTSRILEIGCGTSTLARTLSLGRRRGDCKMVPKSAHHPPQQLHILATDVSAVCIAQNRQRDEAIMQEARGSSLDYQVLNVIDPEQGFVVKHSHSFDVVLDKGCLDTFLFRSAESEREGLVTKLLHTVFRLLLLEQGRGRYLVLSPRSKLKPLRDFCGFSSVQRIILPTDGNGGALEGKSRGKEQVYLYACIVNSDYLIGKGPAFVCRDDAPPSVCQSCGITFDAFRKKEEATKQLLRRWNGHVIHCRPTSMMKCHS